MRIINVDRSVRVAIQIFRIRLWWGPQISACSVVFKDQRTGESTWKKLNFGLRCYTAAGYILITDDKILKKKTKRVGGRICIATNRFTWGRCHAKRSDSTGFSSCRWTAVCHSTRSRPGCLSCERLARQVQALREFLICGFEKQVDQCEPLLFAISRCISKSRCLFCLGNHYSHWRCWWLCVRAESNGK